MFHKADWREGERRLTKKIKGKAGGGGGGGGSVLEEVSHCHYYRSTSQSENRGRRATECRPIEYPAGRHSHHCA